MDEKKKLAIMGLLLVVIGGIGAFQFLGGHSGAAPQPTTKTAPKVTAAVKPPVDNPEVAAPLPRRDPFAVPAGMEATMSPLSPKPPSATSTATPRGRPRSIPNFPSQPLPMAGNIAPLGQGGRLPGAPAPSFDYQVVAVIVGARSAAILRDPQGSQRLITSGSAIDGDSRLLSVNRDNVLISFRGRTLRLSTGGNPVAK